MTAVYLIAALLVAVIVFLLILPKTHTLRITGNLATTPEKIFSVITDLTKAPQWVPHCTHAVKTDGRDGAARKQKVSFEKEGAASTSEDQQVTTWVDNRQYGWKLLQASGSRADARTVITLTQRQNITEVEILGEWTASSWLGKIPAAFSEPKRLRADYEEMISRLRKSATT